VAPTPNAKKSTTKPCALVCPLTLEVLQVVVLNVSLALNVLMTKHAQTKSVLTLVLTLADRMRNAESITTAQSAIAWKAILVIHLVDVTLNHVRTSHILLLLQVALIYSSCR
jgi:hypothetical protein